MKVAIRGVVAPFTMAVLLGAAPAPGTPSPAADEPGARAEDRAAIRAAMRSFVKAFEARDAKAVAGHWTAEGEYINEDGEAVRGREALEKGFAAFFAKTPEVRAEVKPGPMRFLSRDSAIEEGSVAIRGASAERSPASDYSALFVREDGRWRMALLSETPGEDGDSLEDLGWLVGEWSSKEEGEGAEIRTTYAWDENGKFLRVRFTIKEKDRTLSGFQVLGKDPATGELRAWTFEAGGGIGEAVWVRDGDHWTAEATGTLADGRTLIATNILRRIDGDTFTWQSIDRSLDDEELPDLPPTKVTRVKAPR
jgi:uncharacterized protein (TIGR02246 family)